MPKMLETVRTAVVVANLLTSARAWTTPQDKTNCKLNSSSLFSWVVQIWDDQKDGGAGTASIGSLITHRAVLTTAWYFSLADTENNLHRYTVYGQNIWNYGTSTNDELARTNPCRQERKILYIDLHPKSKEGGPLGRLLFDYSIINLVKVFNVSTPTFPVMKFPESALNFLYDIQRINSLQAPQCVMPVPESEDNPFLVFSPRISVKTLLFHKTCIKHICEEPGQGSVNEDCSHILQAASNGTMLCMIPEWTRRFEIATRSKIGDFPNYLAGTPLVCQDKTYGTSTQVKRRAHLNYQEFKQSFFFIITLLRIWRWLKSNILLHSVDPESYTIPARLKTQSFYDPPSPSFDFVLPTLPPDSDFLPFDPAQTISKASKLPDGSAILSMSVGALQILLTCL